MKKWQITITLICVLTGLFIAFNLRIQENIRSSNSPGTQRTEALASIVENLERENERYETEIAQIRAQIEELQKQESEGNGSLKILNEKLENARATAGHTALEGPGITLRLDDRNAALEVARKEGGSINYWNYLVHDSDLVNLVNDLKLGGAEAIAINGERIITTSDIKCGGFIVFTNGTRLGAPYVITALGNPDLLEETVKNGFTYNTLIFQEYPLQIVKSESLIAPPYRGSYRLKFSEVVKEETK
jgi:uncharacterized protein YlxW (UPF0749 family)